MLLGDSKVNSALLATVFSGTKSRHSEAVQWAEGWWTGTGNSWGFEERGWWCVNGRWTSHTERNTGTASLSEKASEERMDGKTEVLRCKNPPKMFVIFPKDEAIYLSLMALDDRAMSTVLPQTHSTIHEFQVQHTRTDRFSRMASELAGARVYAHKMFCLKTKPKNPLHFFSC